MGTVSASQDETDFRRAFDQHYRDILAYAKRRSPITDAEDIAAETFAIAWRRWKAAPPDAVRPWLFGIARKVVANSNRSLRRRNRLSAKISSFAEPAGSDIPFAEHADMVQALDTLSASEREIIRLHCWEDLAVSEIAVALRCSANAAGIRLHRAKRHLAQALATTSGGRS
ncbi:MAG: sigma-70 family RNA polymerase sigma factor [Acidimicrobiia bacterium]|nr:sigma-70 family RNA polymerase sigma factor [Acidimicrobiia bacterium]